MGAGKRPVAKTKKMKTDDKALSQGSAALPISSCQHTMSGYSVIPSLLIVITCAKIMSIVAYTYISGRVVVCGDADMRPLEGKSSGLKIRLP